MKDLKAFKRGDIGILISDLTDPPRCKKDTSKSDVVSAVKMMGDKLHIKFANNPETWVPEDKCAKLVTVCENCIVERGIYTYRHGGGECALCGETDQYCSALVTLEDIEIAIPAGTDSNGVYWGGSCVESVWAEIGSVCPHCGYNCVRKYRPTKRGQTEVVYQCGAECSMPLMLVDNGGEKSDKYRSLRGSRYNNFFGERTAVTNEKTFKRWLAVNRIIMRMGDSFKFDGETYKLVVGNGGYQFINMSDARIIPDTFHQVRHHYEGISLPIIRSLISKTKDEMPDEYPLEIIEGENRR